ncbi:sensor histidine kinase [Microbacterium sp. NPDC012755]|uniref:sensor histidine kinase n=1 Tax=Microbacterium sp. NPDC012755 TaxID=3364184 RepID=UPI00369D2DCC
MTQQIDLPEVPKDPHPAPRWLPDVLVALIVVATAFLPGPVAEFLPVGPAVMVLVLTPVVILPWRRRWPAAVLVLLVIVFGVAAAAGTLSPGAGIAVAVAVFHVATRTTRLRGFIIGSCAAITLMLLSLLVSVGSPLDPRVLQFGLLVAFAAAAGDGARSRRAYIAAITERAERAVQTREAEALRRVSEERLRIARDLHDAVAHQISVISLSAGVASSVVDVRPEKAKESLATIRAAARTVLREIGDLMAMLRADEHGGTAPRPQAGLGQLEELVASFAVSGLDVHTRIEGDPGRVSGATDLVAYRVVQEALTNAHKHSTEHRAHVLIHVATDTVGVTVTNPMDAAAAIADEPRGSGLGLIGLRERIAAVRGSVTAGPAPAGWKVEAVLPLAREATP